MAKDNFNIIYERNYQRSFMFAKSYVHDDMIAEDIVSDSLVKYWRLISTQKEKQQKLFYFRSWEIKLSTTYAIKLYMMLRSKI